MVLESVSNSNEFVYTRMDLVAAKNMHSAFTNNMSALR
ncbi:hypothetical protein C5167_027130, partial [Papaver somniferum]